MVCGRQLYAISEAVSSKVVLKRLFFQRVAATNARYDFR